MHRHSTLLIGLALAAAPLAGCSDRASPSAPDGGAIDLKTVGGTRSLLSRLVAIDGAGRGRIRVTRIEHPTTPGNFAVHIELVVKDATPSTRYLVQRAAETVPPFGVDATTVDGSCQRALNLPPWSTITPTPPPSFVTFPLSFPTPPHPGPVTFTTDRHGNAQLEFTFISSNQLPSFDVMLRLIEDSTAPTSVLQSQCLTVPATP